jgi:ATP-dependent RNA helicase RhlE
VLIEVARRNQTAELIAQKVHPVGREMKKDLLVHLVKDNDWHQVLVFTRMKHGANRLVEHLLKHDITAMAIHGNKSQTARTKALADFKRGDLQVLVATDIAARGIDIDQLPHVVNSRCRTCPRTTSTASAAPAAPAPRARRSRSSASTRTGSCATSSG